MGREGSPGDPQTRSCRHHTQPGAQPGPGPRSCFSHRGFLGTQTLEEIHRVNCNSRGHPGARLVPRSLATSIRVRGRFAPAWQLAGGSEVPGGLETCSGRDLGPKAGRPSPAGRAGQMLGFVPEQSARGKSRDKMHGRFMQHRQKINSAKSCYSTSRNMGVFPFILLFCYKMLSLHPEITGK